MGTPRPALDLSRLPGNRTQWVLVLLLFGGLLLWQCGPRPPHFIAREQVQALVEVEARRQGLEPRFVLAIIEAESSFNAHASSGSARGMMQLTRPAWRTVTVVPYAQAWDWQLNVRVGIAYLAHCRELLVREGQFSLPLLAACYRYGFGTLRDTNFNLGRLPVPSNAIYQQLLQGNLPP